MGGLRDGPRWDRLYEQAAAQEGYFTTQQAAAAGYSPQLLLKHLRAGRLARVRHGIYRLVHFPAGEHEELAVIWLWSQQRGVFSHRTALALHGLSDVLPAQVDLTLPAAWRCRRFRVPSDVVLRYGDVPGEDRVWIGPVPVTSPGWTLRDCAAIVSPDQLREAARQALRRGLVVEGDLTEVDRALIPFAGVAS
jgi:predicted transcriptional regulator of viral defense system